MASDIDNYPVPSRLSAAIFHAKATVLQTRRGLVDIAAGIRRHRPVPPECYPFLLAQSKTSLWDSTETVELPLVQGKVQNLRRAIRHLSGILIPAGETFSFWKQVGRASTARGYVSGRLLREGCLMPAVGGGLCQLSNAIYQTALDSGCQIVERHAHSRVIPGSAAEVDRDATVAWNYIDLRFVPSHPILLTASLTADELIVAIHSRTEQPKAKPSTIPLPLLRTSIDTTAHSCITCGQEDCFRHQPRRTVNEAGPTAYILDESWPEFQAYVASIHKPTDNLAVPFDSRRWNAESFSRVDTSLAQALLRSLAARRLSHKGALRLQAQLTTTDAIARRLSRALTIDTAGVCVSQSLLPTLWEEGHLGGREFDVLMTRLPLGILHDRLDQAAARFPDRSTLAEYRAPTQIVRAETEALAAARHVITPHREIASLFPSNSILLDWSTPPSTPTPLPDRRDRIAFAGPTAARKGAYELREIARALDLEVSIRGSELEAAGFWDGVRTVRLDNWLDGCFAVVQPALVEDRPRPLLAAQARGIPVIATSACGIDGIVAVEWGDSHLLQAAVESIMNT